MHFLLYGVACSCRRGAPAHCGCGCREARRKAACLCCWRTRPASRLARCKRCISRPAVASQIRGASTLRDALYRVDWSVLPGVSAAVSSH